MKRPNDIIDVPKEQLISVTVNGRTVPACRGETVLSTLIANGYKVIYENDHGVVNGPYCGMGTCFLCCVTINGRYKRRSCQIYVEENMKIEIKSNLHTKPGFGLTRE